LLGKWFGPHIGGLSSAIENKAEASFRTPKASAGGAQVIWISKELSRSPELGKRSNLLADVESSGAPHESSSDRYMMKTEHCAGSE